MKGNFSATNEVKQAHQRPKERKVQIFAITTQAYYIDVFLENLCHSTDR